jgi:hypothetical protein
MKAVKCGYDGAIIWLEQGRKIQTQLETKNKQQEIK